MKTVHPSEEKEQAELIKWCGLYRWGDKRLSEIIFSIQNGTRCSPRVASRLKRTGGRPGVSDLFLPIPINKFIQKGQYGVVDVSQHHGLFIEMKKIGGKESKAQVEFRIDMTKMGYKVVVCEGWVKAATEIASYLHQPMWSPL